MGTFTCWADGRASAFGQGLACRVAAVHGIRPGAGALRGWASRAGPPGSALWWCASGLYLDSGGARAGLGPRARARLAPPSHARLVHGSAWVALVPLCTSVLTNHWPANLTARKQTLSIRNQFLAQKLDIASSVCLAGNVHMAAHVCTCRYTSLRMSSASPTLPYAAAPIL